MPDLKDFLAAASVLAQNTGAGRAQLPFLSAFEKYSSFEDVPTASLRALRGNLAIVPVEGGTAEILEKLLAILDQEDSKRQEERRLVDDQNLNPLQRREYDSADSFVARVTRLYPNIPEVFAQGFLFSFNRSALESPIDFTRSSYRFEMWATEDAVERISCSNPIGIEMEIQKFIEQTSYREEYSDAAFVYREGTWPVPLQLLEQPGSPTRFEILGNYLPFAFVLASHRMGWKLQEAHGVCVAAPAG